MARNKTYKETKLPKRLDKSVAGAVWQVPDVLVGALRNRYQLVACLQCGFYHMPVTNIDPKKGAVCSHLPIPDAVWTWQRHPMVWKSNGVAKGSPL